MMKSWELIAVAMMLALPLFAQQEGTAVEDTTRETMEWANLWWDHAPDTTLPRVLLVGDSIANQYSGDVRARLKGTANVDLLATSASICDPVFVRLVALESNYKYAVIHFNNGLHGFHLSDAQYETGLRALVALLRAQQPQAKLIWAQSTPIVVANEVATLAPGNEKVLQRNEVAARVMAELQIPVNDLYSVSVGHPEYRNAGDGYHYNAAGKAAQGEVVAKVVAERL